LATNNNYANWAEAFSIFTKYSSTDREQNVSWDGDMLYAGPDPKKVDRADIDRLEALKWHAHSFYGCFYHNM